MWIFCTILSWTIQLHQVTCQHGATIVILIMLLDYSHLTLTGIFLWYVMYMKSFKILYEIQTPLTDCENFWAFTGLRRDFGLILLILNMIIRRRFMGPTHLLSANVPGPVSFVVSALTILKFQEHVSKNMVPVPEKSYQSTEFISHIFASHHVRDLETKNQLTLKYLEKKCSLNCISTLVSNELVVVYTVYILLCSWSCSADKCQWWGSLNSILPFVILTTFQYHLRTGYLLNIIFIFDRCHHS